MSKWNLIGQVGNVIKKDNFYIINIAENKYKYNKESKKWEKDSTVWFNCISDFEPKVSKSDRVIAEGIFIPSFLPNLPFSMKIEHIGVIQK